MAAATKLNQRALDNLYTPSLVAVGTFKVSVADGTYFCEIHQIVAGAEEDDLKCVFVPSEKVEAACFFGAKKVKNLGAVIRIKYDFSIHSNLMMAHGEPISSFFRNSNEWGDN